MFLVKVEGVLWLTDHRLIAVSRSLFSLLLTKYAGRVAESPSVRSTHVTVAAIIRVDANSDSAITVVARAPIQANAKGISFLRRRVNHCLFFPYTARTLMNGEPYTSPIRLLATSPAIVTPSSLLKLKAEYA